MNRSEIETILFRIGVTFPSYRGDAIEQRARVEEWIDSPVAAFDFDVATVAFGELKATASKPPSIAQFTDACRAVLRRREPERALSAADDGPTTEAAEALTRIAGIREVVKSIPVDERPTRPFHGSLIHESTS